MSWLPSLLLFPMKRHDRFTALVRPHLGSMYRMAYRWTQHRDDAEDLVQDVLTRLVNRVDELACVEKLNPWLIKVLYRRYVDVYRRKVNSPVDFDYVWRSDDTPYEELPGSTDDIGRLELQRSLSRAMESLDHDQRDVVLLHDVEGHSALDVADILNVNLGTVKSRLHRARQKLKLVLQEGTF